jgi:hypothetical protein
MSSSISGEEAGDDAEDDNVNPASSFSASVCACSLNDSPKRLATLRKC